MKTIYKYQLTHDGISMPKGAKFLHVALQVGLGTMWFEVETDEEEIEERHFVIVGTGHPVPTGDVKYLGTYFQDIFVWHVYEVRT